MVGIDNLNSFYSTELKHYRLNRLKAFSNFEFVPIDITNQIELGDFFQKQGVFDAVINLAAQAGVRQSFKHPEIYFRTNVNGCRNLLEAMLEFEISKFVLASSSTLYAGWVPPFQESNEFRTLQSPYAESKRLAESIASQFHQKHSIDVSILRYFTAYGPAGRPDMCYLKFAKRIDDQTPIELFGDGEQARDFTYIDDIVAATIAALRPVGCEVFNVGSGESPISINELIRQLGGLLGKTPVVELHPAHRGDLATTQADCKKAKRILGWEAQVDFETGLSKTVDWYKKNRTLFSTPPISIQ